MKDVNLAGLKKAPAKILTENVLPELARTVNRAQANIEGLLNEAVENAVIAGQALIEAKALVNHGEWQDWIEANCSMSDRSARSYMRLARELPKLDYEKRQSVAVLPLRDVIASLANPKASLDWEVTAGDLPLYIHTPKYCEAMNLIDEVEAWSAEGFPGASLENLAKIATNIDSESQAAGIRLRAESEAANILGGAA